MADGVRLRDQFVALLMDLDGTLYRGHAAVSGAVQALSVGEQTVLYVTNSASRSAGAVAQHLVGLGFRARADEVVTSAQAAAHLLAERLVAGAAVLVVGTEDLVAEIARVGLRPVRRFAAEIPAAVVQGHSPHTGWSDLAEATYALRAGALWVAANTDATVPTERGLAPGHGAMVSALRTATEQEPVVAGKPYAPLLEAALARAGTRSALVVGDRLDTDIDGAYAVGLPSMLVLTGVSVLSDLHKQPADRLPTLVADSLDALNHPVVPNQTDDSDDDPVVRLAELLRRNPGRAIRTSRA